MLKRGDFLICCDFGCQQRGTVLQYLSCSAKFDSLLTFQSVSPRISIAKQNEEVGCIGVYRTGSFTALWCSYVKAETDEQQVISLPLTRLQRPLL